MDDKKIMKGIAKSILIFTKASMISHGICNPMLIELLDMIENLAEDKVEEFIDKYHENPSWMFKKICLDRKINCDAWSMDFVVSIIYLVKKELTNNQYKRLYAEEMDARKLAKKLKDEYLLENTYLQNQQDFINKNMETILYEVIRNVWNKALENTDFNFSVIQEINRKIDNNNEQLKIYDEYNKYRNKYEQKLFLDDDPNVTLKSLYVYQNCTDKLIDGHYEQGDTIGSREYFKKFLENDNNDLLVILSQPGCGKSSFISRIINDESIINQKHVMVISLKNIENLSKIENIENVGYKLFEESNYDFNSSDDLLIFLDGLDEIIFSENDNYLEFVNSLYEYVNCTSLHIKIVITSRYNRFNIRDLDCKYINLLPLNTKQINQFIDNYKKSSGKDIKRSVRHFDFSQDTEEVNRVLGIPHITYMVLATGIDLNANNSILDIYSQLFSMKQNKNSVYWRAGYWKKHNITADEKMVKMIHLFSKKVALYIWEHNPEHMTISSSICKEIVENVYETYRSDYKGSISELLFKNLLIGQYFYEGQNDNAEYELYFVHKSILEYFVSLTIFDCVKEVIETHEAFDELYQNRNEKLARLAKVLMIHNLNEFPEIKEYLLQLIRKNKIEIEEALSYARKFINGFGEYGLADIIRRDKYENDIKLNYVEKIRKNIIIFYNLIIILREIVFTNEGETRVIDLIQSNGNMLFYLKYNNYIYRKDLSYLKLTNLDLRHSNFKDSILTGVDFSGTDLSHAQLKGATLDNVDLRFTNLRGVNFTFVNLSKVNLSGVALKTVVMQSVNLIYANLSDADLSKLVMLNSVFIGANLQSANLSDTNLDGSNFHTAKLENIVLTGASLKKARIDSKYRSDLECQEGVDLNEVYWLSDDEDRDTYGDCINR